VLATDFSEVAVRYQRRKRLGFDCVRVAAALLPERHSTNVRGSFEVMEQDFTRARPDREFDVVIDCRAFQGLSSRAMRAAAKNFYASLRPGGTLFVDTMNVADTDHRNRIEDSLVGAGFHLPSPRSEPSYRYRSASRRLLDGVGTKRDQEVIDSFCPEYKPGAERKL
jgi:hypothetical protein